MLVHGSLNVRKPLETQSSLTSLGAAAGPIDGFQPGTHPLPGLLDAAFPDRQGRQTLAHAPHNQAAQAEEAHDPLPATAATPSSLCSDCRQRAVAPSG